MGPTPHDVREISVALAAVFRDAYGLGHPYAQFLHGRLVGTDTPTSLSRPRAHAHCLPIPRRDCALVLRWASQYIGTRLDPRLRRALHHPYAAAYLMIAPSAPLMVSMV